MEEVKIDIEKINKSYESDIIFKDFNIQFYKNKVNCILGKSGCGKSTLLNIISGLLENDIKNQGRIKSFNLSYVFQDDRLIDWLTVDENIKLIIKQCYRKNELDDVCDKYLKIVGLEKYKKYYPQMLSGGLRQRVNIARAFAYKSDIILMDEPFKSIDVKNKANIINEIKELLSKDKRTAILVTHDIEEAIELGQYIYILGDRPVTIKNIFYNDKNIVKEEIQKFI